MIRKAAITMGAIFIVISAIFMFSKQEKGLSTTRQASGLLEKDRQEIPSDKNLKKLEDWKMYTNEKYGFKFKYPSNYTYSETRDFKGLYEEKIAFLKVIVWDKTIAANNTLSGVEFWVYRNDTPDLKTWIEKHSANLSISAFEGTKITSKDIIVSGNEPRQISLAKKSDSADREYEISITAKGNYVFGLISSSRNQTDREIYSSFEFIN